MRPTRATPSAPATTRSTAGDDLRLFGGEGDDEVFGGDGDEAAIVGGDGIDDLKGQGGDDFVDAFDGEMGDDVSGGNDDDTCNFDVGDTFAGCEVLPCMRAAARGGCKRASPATPAKGAPKCQGETPTIMGTNGNDDLNGTSGPNIINAGGGNDEVHARGGNNLVCGRGGKDELAGGGDVDRLRGRGRRGPDHRQRR